MPGALAGIRVLDLADRQGAFCGRLLAELAWATAGPGGFDWVAPRRGSMSVIAGAGFDWILIDTEHSPADLENVLRQLQAAAPYATEAVVRVPWCNRAGIRLTIS